MTRRKEKNPGEMTIPLAIGSGIAGGTAYALTQEAMKRNPSERMCMLYRKIKQKFPDLDYETFDKAYNIAIQQPNPPESHERYETFHGVPVDRIFKADIPDPVGELTAIDYMDRIVYECEGKESVGDDGEDTSYVHDWEKNKMILVRDKNGNYFIAGKCRVIKSGINDFKGRPTWNLDKFKIPKIPKKVTYLGLLPEIRAGRKLYKFRDTILCTDAKGQHLYITELRKTKPTHPTFR